MRKNTSGFTIVELLIVIVVIAILAAISIVAYNGIQARANQTAVKSDISNFRKKMELIRLDASDGLYPTSPTANMGFRFTKQSYRTGSDFNLYYCVDSTRTKYSLGTATKNGTIYITTNDGKQVEVSGLGNTSTCNEIGATDPATRTVLAGYNGTAGVWDPWTN